MKISLIAVLRLWGLVGLLTGCSVRAPAAPAPLSPAAAAANALEALTGTIAITRRRLTGHFEDAAFLEVLRQVRIDRIPSLEKSDPGDAVAWQIDYIVFLSQPLRGGFVRTSFYDLTDGGKRLVAVQDQGKAKSNGTQRALSDTLQLLSSHFAPKRHYRIAVEVDGQAVGVTTFWLLAPGESDAARANTVAAVGPRAIPDEPPGPSLGDDLAPPQYLQRVPGSLGCVSPTLPQVEGGAPGSPSDSKNSGVRRPPALEKRIVQSAIRQHIPAIKACYEARMIDRPYPQGRLLTRFSIDRAGKVPSSCAVESTVNDPLIDRCILEEILHWEFAKPKDGGWVVVEYPFVLKPE